jgi:hypothetical protein
LSSDERAGLIYARANECKLRPHYTGPVLLGGDGDADEKVWVRMKKWIYDVGSKKNISMASISH